MIEIKKLIEVSGNPPYEIIVNTKGISQVEQRSDFIYEITITYDNEDQISSADNVTVVDDLGCIRSTPLQINNPCDTFYVSDILRLTGQGNTNQTNRENSSSYTIESNQAATIDWEIDNEDYYSTELQGSTIILTQIRSGIQQTTLRAIVTNLNGCSEERTFQLFPCRVLAKTTNWVLRLESDGVYRANRVPMLASSSCTSDSSVDWSTAQIENNSTVTVTQRPNQPYLDIESFTSIPETTIYFTVKDQTGIMSNRGKVVLTSTEEQVPTTGPGFYPIVENVPANTTTFSVPTSELGLPSNLTDLSTVPSLTTATSASITNSNLSVDMTGQQTATVGITGNINNVPIQPSTITFVREQDVYEPSDLEYAVFCNSVQQDLSQEADINSVDSIISGDATLNNNTITINSPSQVIKARVLNDDNQVGEVTIYACGECLDSILITTTTCESTINLYDQLEGVNPEGTWQIVPGGGNQAAVTPANYNDSIGLPTNGSYIYTYNSPNTVGDYECTNTTTQSLNITKASETLVTNNACADAEVLPSLLNESSTQIDSTISAQCNNKTTYSGNDGDLSAYQYDQWYEITTRGDSNDVNIIVTLQGISNDPIQDIAVQVWSDCGTTLSTAKTNSISTATATYTQNQGVFPARYIQVLSNSPGSYRLTVEQEFTTP